MSNHILSVKPKNYIFIILPYLLQYYHKFAKISIIYYLFTIFL